VAVAVLVAVLAAAAAVPRPARVVLSAFQSSVFERRG
jgi:hypothetical protein